jgi:hypothetical protein
VRKTITLMLVAVLALAVTGPVAAKKKKKPRPAPVDVQYFLRTGEGCELSLSLTDGEDASDCFYGVDDMFNEYPQLQGNAVFAEGTDHYIAAEGLPLTLDPTRKATGTISIRAYGAPGTLTFGIGNAEVDLTLKATVAGEEKELGTFTHAYTAGPNHVEVVEFEIPIDPAFAGVVAEGLTLDVWTHGTVLFGRGIEHDSEIPPSIKVPALK